MSSGRDEAVMRLVLVMVEHWYWEAWDAPLEEAGWAPLEWVGEHHSAVIVTKLWNGDEIIVLEVRKYMSCA